MNSIITNLDRIDEYRTQINQIINPMIEDVSIDGLGSGIWTALTSSLKKISNNSGFQFPRVQF